MFHFFLNIVSSQGLLFNNVSFQGKRYQRIAMFFTQTDAPTVVTKVVSVVAAHLRTQDMRLAVYLDDRLCLNQIQQQLLKYQYDGCF